MGGRRDARRLALARFISMAGSGAASIALAAELWARTGNAVWVAAAALSTSLVAGLLTPFAGALVDRSDRRRVMIRSDALAGAVFSALAVAVFLEAPPLLLVLMAGTAAVCETPFIPASRAAVPNLVGDGDLAWANGLIAQVGGISIMLGPVIGGVLAGGIGAPAALAVNAVSFLASLWLVVSIRGSFGDRPCGMTRERGAVRAGFRFVASDRLLRAVIASGFVAFIGVGFVIAANPAMADVLGAGATGLGLMSASWGLGVVVGARLSPALLRGDRLVAWAVAGFALQGVGHLLVWRLPNLATVMIAFAVGGLGGGIADPARQTLIQRRAPDAVRGRVFATMEAVGWTSFAISLLAAGALVERVGIRPSYLVSGSLFLLGTFLMAVLGRPWRLRTPAAPPLAAVERT